MSARRRLKKRRQIEDALTRVSSLNSFIVEDDKEDSSDFYPPSTHFTHSTHFLDDNLDSKEQLELDNIRQEMETEIPTLKDVLNSNITTNEKKTCLRLMDQLGVVDEYTEDYFRLIDSLNEILSKGKFYTPEQILFLEAEETKLKNMYISRDTLKTKILLLQAAESIKSKLLSMYEEMLTYPSDSSIYNSLKEEIEWSIRLPYAKREIDPYVGFDNSSLNAFYCQVKRLLDQELYGMEEVKNRIIHILNDRRSSGDSCGRNIALVGNPGTGKTAICKTLSNILNKKFAKISAGALDSAAIKGSNKVYIGSQPSIILQKLAELKTNNAVIMIDEPDKMDIRAQHALLHVSDPGDNKEFQDNYLQNFSHDLSNIFFVYCLNDETCLDSALKDRLDIIHVADYTNTEKFQIFKNYMLPKALINVNLSKNSVVIKDVAIKKLLEEKELGLRNLEKIIKNIIGKVNMYKNVVLPNGSLGKLVLPYTIPNFKLPLKIDYKLLKELI